MIATEVELRGPLTEQQAAYLLDLAAKADANVNRQWRLFLDYSTFLEGVAERKSDIRLRRTNGMLEAIVKVGQFGGAARKEAAVKIDDTFEAATNLYALLGFTKAMAGDRRISRFDLGEIEVCVTEVRYVPDTGVIWGLFYEVEWMGKNETVEQATQKLQEFIAAHGLDTFDANAWADFSIAMNSEPNTVYEHGMTDVRIFNGVGQLAA